MSRDGNSHTIDASLPAEQALEKRKQQVADAARFLKDPEFRKAHIAELQKRAGREPLRSSLRNGGDRTDAARTDDRGLQGQARGGGDSQLTDESVAREGMTDDEVLEAIEVGAPKTGEVRTGLAGTIRLRSTGMLPQLPKEELERETGREEAAYKELKAETTTGILGAVKADREARTFTFPGRDEKGTNGSGQ